MPQLAQQQQQLAEAVARAATAEARVAELHRNAAPGETAMPMGADLSHALHAQILSRLGPSPVAEDQLLRDVGIAGAQIGPALVALELDGQIQRHAGGLISRLN